MPLLRRLAGFLMALVAGLMYPFAILFASGDPDYPAYGLAFGIFALGGIYLPVLLCGLHLMFFGPDSPFAARVAIVAVLALVVILAIVAMLPFLLTSTRRDEAADAIMGVLVMSGLFGWPMVLGLSRALPRAVADARRLCQSVNSRGTTKARVCPVPGRTEAQSGASNCTTSVAQVG
jgi:hypothetical protein